MKISPAPITVIPQPAPTPAPEPEDDQDHLFEPEDEVTEPSPDDRSHDWIVAATVAVDEKVAKHSFLRGSFRTAADQRIDALEVYCMGCRRPYDEVADRECEAKIDNTHLIGGDPGVRKKRKVGSEDDAGEWVPAPPIQRYGIESVVFGDN